MHQERERSFLETFVVSRKRDRYAGFLESPKRRRRFLGELYHFGDFNPACVIPLTGPSDTEQGLVEALRRLGARDECYVISARKELDGITGPLEDIVSKVFTFAEGTVICCVPGRLAYYEGEAPHQRFILFRDAGN